MRIAPTSRRVISPAPHSIGNSQRGSALCLRPTDSVNHALGPNASRGGRTASERGAAGRDASGPLTSISSSGAAMPARRRRRKAAATCSAPCRSISAATIARSPSATGAASAASSRMRASSRARISAGPGARIQVAETPADASSPSARRRARIGVISAQTPLRPARPVRPLRCSSVSRLAGRSAWITSSSPGRSMPRAATSVAMHTRARPSRIACSAWLRSVWLSSPDSATTFSPRLVKRAAM